MNMSYCRFENTAQDLADCKENLFDGEVSKSERAARKNLVSLCYDIIQMAGGTIEEEENELIENVEERSQSSEEEEDDFDPAGGRGLHSHE